jgi:cytochrome bd-type quinol oxidase subunit 2
MKWAALIAWLVTAGGGFVMLAIWLRAGGMAKARESGRRIRPPLLLGHFALAVVGLVLWIVYLANDSDSIKWIAFVLLLIIALLGFTMLAIWVGQRQQRGARAVADVGAEPAERRFPPSVVTLHGLAAVATLVLVFLTNIGVGES